LFRFGEEQQLAEVVARGARELGRLEMDIKVLDALERDGTRQNAHTHFWKNDLTTVILNSSIMFCFELVVFK
jgi:hypothetical protein